MAGLEDYICGSVPKFSVYIDSIRHRKYNRNLQFAHTNNVYIDGNSICHMYAPSN